MRNKVFFALRVLTGFLFVVSGSMKLLQPYQNFLAVIDRFEITSGPLSIFVAKALPWAEFLAGIFFLLGLWTGLSLTVLWGLNTIFIGVVVQALLRQLPIENCGCFGEALPLRLWQILGLDIALWVLFAVLFRFRHTIRSYGLDGLFHKEVF